MLCSASQARFMISARLVNDAQALGVDIAEGELGAAHGGVLDDGA